MLGKVALVHLASEDEARLLVKTVKVKGLQPELRGNKLRVDPAKTTRNKQRDWALREAAKLLKEWVSKNQPGKKVERGGGKVRKVKVDGVVAFKQKQEDTKGSFCEGVSHLALP